MAYRFIVRCFAVTISLAASLLPMAAQVEILDAAQLDFDTILAFERTLSRLSDAVADRYFLHGANAVPTARLAALA